ncbi:MAG: hypothetical protein ACREJR_06895, partial [Candidatus Rokuibacteriota bacterium]
MVLGLLVLTGSLLQACSDNNGTVGPTFQCQDKHGETKKGGVKNLAECTAPTTGFADTSSNILIRVSANPASTEPGRSVTITVLVTNGAGQVGGGSGQPLAGRRVFVSTSAAPPVGGQIDAPSGVTDANGIYRTSMIVRCVDAGVVPPVEPAPEEPASGNTVTTVTVNAFVDGATSAVGGTSATVVVTGTSGS